MKTNKVYIVAQVEGNDIRFFIAFKNLKSDIMIMSDMAPRINGNPYTLFGKHIEEFTGLSRYDDSILIVISQVTSGHI